MHEDLGCLSVFAVFALLVLSFLIYTGGKDAVRTEYRSCRTLLNTSDSATVLRMKPECQYWTLPMKVEVHHD